MFHRLVGDSHQVARCFFTYLVGFQQPEAWQQFSLNRLSYGGADFLDRNCGHGIRFSAFGEGNTRPCP